MTAVRGGWAARDQTAASSAPEAAPDLLRSSLAPTHGKQGITQWELDLPSLWRSLSLLP